MGIRDYERLAIEPFGRQLITSGDLDPVYIALRGVDWSPSQRNRWLIAYWCFYHCGLASYAAANKGARFWEILHTAATNASSALAPTGGRWPRGHERRHARGKQGINMVNDLARRYYDDPNKMVDYICGGTTTEFSAAPPPVEASVATFPLPFKGLVDRVQEHSLFGPWIGFKVADMVDRVLGIPVSFEHAHVFMFKDPVKAALMLWRSRMNVDENVRPTDQTKAVVGIVNHLEQEFRDWKAPPLYDRPIQLQEVETVLCKWKSHMNGHYPLFNDIDEITEGLEGWGDAAAEFGAAMPKAAGS